MICEDCKEQLCCDDRGVNIHEGNKPCTRGVRFKFQMDPRGNFRIVHTASGKEGASAAYKGIATLEHAGRMYAAVSAYYEGNLPIETVFEIVPQTTESISRYVTMFERKVSSEGREKD